MSALGLNYFAFLRRPWGRPPSGSAEALTLPSLRPIERHLNRAAIPAVQNASIQGSYQGPICRQKQQRPNQSLPRKESGIFEGGLASSAP